LPSRLRDSIRRLFYSKAFGRDSIILVAIGPQDKMKALILTGQRAAGMHLINQFVDISFVWTKRFRDWENIVWILVNISFQSLQGSRFCIVGIHLKNKSA
jgi:hypothetical protein